jgi:hypothetical protein
MFLASDSKARREYRVLRYLASEPDVSLLLEAVDFEWTVCPAVLFLSHSPNSELRARMGDYYSLDAYTDLWRLEVVTGRQCKPLADVVRNWSSVRTAFVARNRLVHGRGWYTEKLAMPHIESLLKGTGYVDDYCETLGCPLYKHMPIRRAPAKQRRAE